MNSFKGHSPPPEVKVHLKVSSDIGGEEDGEGRPEPHIATCACNMQPQGESCDV